MNQFTLILKSTGSKFLSVAKVIAKHTNKELDEVMESLEELPFTVVNDAGEAEAKALAEQLEALGAEVETQKQESMPSGATLVLTDIGPKTIKVAKLVAITTNKELDQVLEALEELPYSIGNLSEEDAAELKEELEVLGAEVQLQKPASPATNVTLVLNAVGPKPLKVAKLIANATKMERDQVLEAIEELPYSIKDLDKEEALKLKEELETLGASVNLTGIPTASPTSCESVKPSGLKDAPAPAPAKNNPKPEDASTSTFDAPVSPEPPESNVQSDSVLTSKFEKDWRKIEKEAELIKKENLLPFSFTDIDGTTAERSVEDFDKQLDSLKTEKFTISVCGMVKAGKSTFLNALLFGEDILPAFDTPMTAKLNFIEYTDEKNHFIVNYYDQEEWNALLENLDEENLQQLNERIQLCAEDYGIDQDDYIGAPPHKEKDLRKLEEFVSDPKSKKGKYTPFVKDVHIFIHNESIKDVRIVDTPGLNDPNVINSRETTKWIKNTHALIFLLPNKGLDESSLKFFDTHLLGTRPTNRVWVINKIDDISDDDLQKTKAYIRQLGTQEEFKAKNLFGRDEKICGYSALIAMLRNMEKQGMGLNEDQVYHLENVGEDFNPDPDQLGNIIGERLYQNTGVKRIIAGVTAINTLYSQHIQKAIKTETEAEMLIKDAQKDDAEIEEEIAALKNSLQSFTRQLGSMKADVERTVFSLVKDEIAKKADKAVDHLSRGAMMKVDGCVKAEQLRSIPFFFRDECTKLFGPYGIVAEGLNNCTRSLQDELKITITKIRSLFTQNEIKGNVDFNPLESLLDTTVFKLENLISDMTSDVSVILSKWSFRSTKQSEVKTIIDKAISDLRGNLQSGIHELESNIDKRIADSFQSFTISIENNINNKKGFLEQDASTRKETLENTKKILEDAKATEKYISELQRIFTNLFPPEISMGKA